MKAAAAALSDEFFAAAQRQGISIGSREPPRTGAITTDGLQLNYLDWGGPAQRPVVFVHGGGLTSRTWDFVCLALRCEFRCIALDLRGHGDSDWANRPDGYVLDAYARDIEALLAQAAVTDAVLVGMSLGGQAALLAAAASPSVLGLVLVDVGPEPDRAAASEIIAGIRQPSAFAELDDVVAYALRLNPRRRAEELRNSLLHNLRELRSGELTWKYDWRAFEAMTLEVINDRTASAWRAVAAVRCPVLIVRGGESAVFGADAADQLRRRLRDARVAVVEDAGHSVQGDNPAGLLRELEPFLRSCFARPDAEPSFA
jgi:pimeloyl-ACP methyl ester carboxylesterase